MTDAKKPETISDDDLDAVHGAGGSPLPEEQREKLEQSLGSDMGGVKVHTDAKSKGDVGAAALTHGSDIILGRGETSSSENLLAHELTHIAKQR